MSVLCVWKRPLYIVSLSSCHLPFPACVDFLILDRILGLIRTLISDDDRNNSHENDDDDYDEDVRMAMMTMMTLLTEARMDKDISMLTYSMYSDMYMNWNPVRGVGHSSSTRTWSCVKGPSYFWNYFYEAIFYGGSETSFRCFGGFCSGVKCVPLKGRRSEVLNGHKLEDIEWGEEI